MYTHSQVHTTHTYTHTSQHINVREPKSPVPRGWSWGSTGHLPLHPFKMCFFPELVSLGSVSHSFVLWLVPELTLVYGVDVHLRSLLLTPDQATGTQRCVWIREPHLAEQCPIALERTPNLQTSCPSCKIHIFTYFSEVETETSCKRNLRNRDKK